MDSTEKYKIYIDEAGDLGIQRGTKWFILSAVIVPQIEEPRIRNTISNIRNKFNLKEIHLRKMHDFYKTSYIVSQVSQHEFTIIYVLMDTDICPLKDSIRTYNYMCRFLLERVSWFLRDNNATGDIILSSRGTKRDGELIKYIHGKLFSYKYNQIADVFDKIQSKPAISWDMLQLADICATSMFKSYEINSLGFVTPCHMSILKDKIYSYNGQINRYGLKFYSEDMKPEANYFKEHKLCNK